MQKKAIRIVCKKSYRAHAQPLFLACNVLHLNQLIAFNCLRLMYDFVNKILPPSFDNTWIRNSETEGYNLRNGDDFQIARFHFSSLKSHPYFNFPKQWNDLKKDFKLTMHRSVFMSTLKKYLLHIIDPSYHPDCFCELCGNYFQDLVDNFDIQDYA